MATSAAGSQGGHERVRIVAPVRKEVGRSQLAEQGQGLRGVVALASRQTAPHETAAGVGHGVHLARQAAAATPHGLRPAFCARRKRTGGPGWWRVDQQGVHGVVLLHSG
jgi:hypothetical protein